MTRFGGKGGPARHALSNFKLELAVAALVVLTLAAIVFADSILKRSIEINPANARSYIGFAYGDQANEGNSTAVENPGRPLSWQCVLRDAYDYPYCGYELLFDHELYSRGIDLSGMQTLTVLVSYEGPGENLRMHLKNHDPRYSKPGRSETSKFNKVEFPVKAKTQRVELELADFSVADWWLTSNRIPPELGRPQFDNVISIDLQTGSGARPGVHRFAIHSIRLEGWALTPAQWYLGILSAWLVLVGFFLGWRISRLKRDLARRQALEEAALRLAQEAELEARHDHLTRLLNRTGVDERYRGMVAGPGGGDVAVLLVDIDRFKSLNDRFGHNYGDEVLSSFAQLLKRNVGLDDIVGRWGGEEFIIICRGLGPGEAIELANKLRSRIEHFHFGDCEKVTASFGVYSHNGSPRPLGELVECADAALYTAKELGRNLAILYQGFMRKAA